MIYEDLIKELKKVKSEKDVTVEITELITDMAIATNMINIENRVGSRTDKEVFNMARMTVLNHFDNYLLSMSEEE